MAFEKKIKSRSNSPKLLCGWEGKYAYAVLPPNRMCRAVQGNNDQHDHVSEYKGIFAFSLLPIPSSPSSLAPPRIWTSSIPGVTLYYLLVSHISPYLVLPHVPLAT